MGDFNQNHLEDYGQTAWIILNAAKSISVGKHRLAEFLKGSKSKHVSHLSSQQGYGGLLWHDIQTIIGFIEQLEQMGFLRRTQPAIDDIYSVLEPTEAGRKIIDEKIMIGLQAIKNEKPLIVGDTEKITLDLFRKGKTIEEIAKERNLAVSTVYGHLHRLVANDCISCSEFVPETAIKQILEAKSKMPNAAKLKEIKEILPENISYNEIRCVLADKSISITRESEDENEEDEFWSGGSFAETMSSEGMKEKMRTFHMKHDEEMNYNCKKCSKNISAHNKDWHDGMCDNCFDKKYFPDG